MDPWWNPATEDQAVDRVHRLGQKKNVEIIRFIVQVVSLVLFLGVV
jgi:SNF2 family DNA or RNA helicase